MNLQEYLSYLAEKHGVPLDQIIREGSPNAAPMGQAFDILHVERHPDYGAWMILGHSRRRPAPRWRYRSKGRYWVYPKGDK